VSLRAPPPENVIAAALVAMAVSVPVYFKLGSEFMRRSTKAPCSTCRRRCRAFRRAGAGPDDRMDKLLKSFPEVERVFGKRGARHVHRPGAVLDDGNHGGAERPVEVERQGTLVLSWAPDFLKPVFRPIWPTASRGMNS